MSCGLYLAVHQYFKDQVVCGVDDQVRSKVLLRNYLGRFFLALIVFLEYRVLELGLEHNMLVVGLNGVDPIFLYYEKVHIVVIVMQVNDWGLRFDLCLLISKYLGPSLSHNCGWVLSQNFLSFKIYLLFIVYAQFDDVCVRCTHISKQSCEF